MIWREKAPLYRAKKAGFPTGGWRLMLRRLGWLTIINTAIVVGVFLLFALRPARLWEVLVAGFVLGANVVAGGLNAYYRGAVDELARMREHMGL